MVAVPPAASIPPFSASATGFVLNLNQASGSLEPTFYNMIIHGVDDDSDTRKATHYGQNIVGCEQNKFYCRESIVQTSATIPSAVL